MERKSYMEEQSIIPVFVVRYVLLWVRVDHRRIPFLFHPPPLPYLFLSEAITPCEN